MRITVAQAIIRCLELEQIEFTFGLSGSHLLSLLKALKGSSIHYISGKHEAALGFMALNYSKITQKPSLILGTAGPGAANLVNGIAEMYKCGIPGIIITPVVSTSSFGKIAFQEDSGYGTSYSIIQIMSAITQRSMLAISGEMVPHYIRELFRCALTPPYGPVHLAVPVNLFSEEIEFDEIKPEKYRIVEDRRVEYQKIKKTADYLKNAKKPLLLIGNRCNYPDCSQALEEFVDITNIPFVLTHASKGILDERKKLFGGVLDYFGHRSAEKLIKESDLIISLGMDFSESETMKYDKDLFNKSKIISLDSSELSIGVNYPLEMGIVGNLPESINMLKKSLEEIAFKSPWQAEDFASQFSLLNENQFKEMNTVTHPPTIMCIFNELSKLLADSVVFLDQSAVGCSSVRHFTAQRRGYFTSPTGYSIAQGVAGVIGGKVALPDRQVFCITGDGAFLMHGAEVLTAAQYNLGITWIIFKEDYYNMIQINQCLAYGGGLEFCTMIRNPDFQHLAKAYHSHYFEVSTLEDLTESITNAKSANLRNETTIIIINYDFEQHLPVKPQLVQTMKDLGQTKDIKSNPYLMKAFAKTLKEKV